MPRPQFPGEQQHTAAGAVRNKPARLVTQRQAHTAMTAQERPHSALTRGISPQNPLQKPGFA